MVRSASLLFCSVLGLSSVVGIHFPRPPTDDKARVARWLVHESDYAISSTSCASERLGCAFKGQPFGDVMSISDGDGLDDSTGIIYTYIPGLDAATVDLVADPRLSLSFSEKALGTCNTTAEDPPCARLTIAGKMTPVPEGPESDKAMKYLLSRHPEMKAWAEAHTFKPYWMAKENISSFFFIDFYGGAASMTVDEYLSASPKPSAEPVMQV
eukprot:TRINITY_DN104617_c0_g1_i1.p2 TRINITY_DN104617_c0_g1~~TRINITY_DN104617_c0_g1_i1.p2  ORF type:complete len:236 (-),score=46.78 TRINITY_DN104617_c0_g1_i1:148-783(-)